MGPAADKYRREFKALLAEEWRALLATNATASETACARLIAKLWRAHVEPVLAAPVAPPVAAPPVPAAVPTAPVGALARARSRRRGDNGGDAASGIGLSNGSSGPTATIVSTPAAPDVAAPAAAAAPYDAQRFGEALDAVRALYLAEARGPATHRALAAFLLEAAPGVARAVDALRAAADAARGHELRERAAGADRAVAAAAARAAAAEATAAELRRTLESATVDAARAVAEAELATKRSAEATARLDEVRS